MATTPNEIVFHAGADAQATWAWLVTSGGHRVFLGPDGKLHAIPLNLDYPGPGSPGPSRQERDMTSEHYEFEYRGAEFQLDDPSDVTTTRTPNVRVIAGSWPTWHLEVTPVEGDPPVVRLLRSVSATNPDQPHPAGNLTPEQSAPDVWTMLIKSDGYLVREPVGETVLLPFRSAEYQAARNASLGY